MPGPLALGSALASTVEDIYRLVKNPEQALRDTMKKYNIVPSEILRNEFIDRFEESGLFKITDGDNADAMIKLTLVSHYFDYGDRGGVRPSMMVKCELVGIEGTVLWKTTELLMKFNNPLPDFSISQLLKDPDLIRQGFTRASQLLTQSIISRMIGR